MVVEEGLLFLLGLEDVEIHVDPVSFEIVGGHHGLEIDPLWVNEGVLNFVFEGDIIEFVEQSY